MFAETCRCVVPTYVFVGVVGPVGSGRELFVRVRIRGFRLPSSENLLTTRLLRLNLMAKWTWRLFLKPRGETVVLMCL